MKKFFKTGIIIAAAAGVLAVSAGPAMAAEPAGPGGGSVVAVQQSPLEEESILPPEEEPGIELLTGEEEPGVPVEVVEEPSNSGSRELTPEQPAPQQPQITAETVSAPVAITKMPETGVNMPLIAALCLGLTAASIGVRRFGMRYSRQ